MDLHQYIEQKHDEHLDDLYELLRIPSVSAQSQHKPDIERAAQWVAERLRRAGLDTVEIVPTKMHPLVYGESLHAPGKPTVLFYGHYDVQPAEPLELWTSPAFEPTDSRRQSLSAAARPTTRDRSTSTFARSTRCSKTGGKAAHQYQGADRGRRGSGQRKPVGFRATK